jgi:hypothetical protein
MAFFNRFGGRNLSGKGVTPIPMYILNITSDVERYDVRTNAISAGWDGYTRCNIIINISAGVTVYSTNYLYAALNANIDASSGTSIRINNQGKIIGAGGKGADGCFTAYKSNLVNTDHPNFIGESLGNPDSGGVWWYMTQSPLTISYLQGGDAIYCDCDLIIDTAYSGAVIGGGGGGGAAGRMGLYGTGASGPEGAAIAKTKAASLTWYQAYGFAAGGAGGGGQGGASAGGTAGSYDAWFTYNGYTSTKGQAACQGNAGNAGSLSAPGTGGVGKDSGEGTGKVFDTGGTGGTLGGIGGTINWGTNTYSHTYYGYENCGPASAGTDNGIGYGYNPTLFSTQYAGATGYPAGQYNPDNLYGGAITAAVRRGRGGNAVRNAASKTIRYISTSLSNMYGSVGA